MNDQTADLPTTAELEAADAAIEPSGAVDPDGFDVDTPPEVDAELAAAEDEGREPATPEAQRLPQPRARETVSDRLPHGARSMNPSGPDAIFHSFGWHPPARTRPADLLAACGTGSGRPLLDAAAGWPSGPHKAAAGPFDRPTAMP